MAVSRWSSITINLTPHNTIFQCFSYIRATRSDSITRKCSTIERHGGWIQDLAASISERLPAAPAVSKQFLKAQLFLP